MTGKAVKKKMLLTRQKFLNIFITSWKSCYIFSFNPGYYVKNKNKKPGCV